MTDEDMDQITEGMTTKSDKIRALDGRGVPRADIAKYLNIRYQHVRNVLVAPKPKRRSKSSQVLVGNPDDVAGLTIDQAKRGLAAHFGVPKDAIEIVIRG